MEDHPNYILNWPYLFKQTNSEDLTQTLWSTTMELEATRIKVPEIIKTKDDHINKLKDILNDVINERDEAQNKYKLLLQQQFHHHHQHQSYNHLKTTIAPPYSGVSSIEDQPITTNAFSPSDCEESILSSPAPVPGFFEIPAKGLPKKGKFLEAVMKAGPLLQNLLIAGALPDWRHPPPPLETQRIPSPTLAVPPVNYLVNCGEFNRKRGFYEDCDSSTETKYQRIL